MLIAGIRDDVTVNTAHSVELIESLVIEGVDGTLNTVKGQRYNGLSIIVRSTRSAPQRNTEVGWTRKVFSQSALLLRRTLGFSASHFRS